MAASIYTDITAAEIAAYAPVQARLWKKYRDNIRAIGLVPVSPDVFAQVSGDLVPASQWNDGGTYPLWVPGCVVGEGSPTTRLVIRATVRVLAGIVDVTMDVRLSLGSDVSNVLSVTDEPGGGATTVEGTFTLDCSPTQDAVNEIQVETYTDGVASSNGLITWLTSQDLDSASPLATAFGESYLAPLPFPEGL